MARKENIYVVSNETNEIIRVSRSVQAALEFLATLPADSAYLCTSELQTLKKGGAISNIVDLL